jgi:single-stranded-DNA-specific exonuclease
MQAKKVKSLKKEWRIRQEDDRSGQLATLAKISPLLSQVLINRDILDIEQAKEFLSPKLVDLIAPEKMHGIPDAAQRVKEAIENQEKIAIYGDYDVDGITSVSILWHLLTILDADVEYYIPHRIDEGYGLNSEAIQQLADNGANLVITVDCGVTAIEQAALANELGMDIIITDHHRPGATLPEAVAIAHPSIDESYPNPDSAGAMVAFKLAWAVVNLCKTTQQTPPELRQFLLNATTLAAIGTIADVVDMRGENRILTSFGLKGLTESSLKGIIALINANSLGGQDLDSYHIAFRLAPMLNAAGRLGHARLAVDLLTSDNERHCMEIAKVLSDLNKKRQKLQRDIFKEVKTKLISSGLDKPENKTVVLAENGWHSGVIGIVASRVVDDFSRPTIIFNITDGIGQGSARSLPGFNIYEAIDACSEHLIGFGGHAMAAGLKIKEENIGDFIAAFEGYAREELADTELTPTLNIDMLCKVGQFTEASVKELARLEPSGQGNPKPTFASQAVHWISPPRRVGQKGDHLQIAISDKTGSVKCIGFGMGQLEKKLLQAESFSIAYQPQLNTFNNRTSVQFVLTDIRF